MASAIFICEKPVLKERDGMLVVENVPCRAGRMTSSTRHWDLDDAPHGAGFRFGRP